jgi:hypothetical protein
VSDTSSKKASLIAVSKKQKQRQHISRGRAFTPAAWLNHPIGTHLGFLLIGPGFFLFRISHQHKLIIRHVATVLIHDDTLQNGT